MLAAEKGAVEIDRDDAAPGGIISVLDGGEERDPGGIDETVEPPACALDLGQDAAPIVLRGDVERMIDAGPTREIGRNGNAALTLDGHRNGSAYGARRPGDEHDLVLEAGHGT